MTFAADKLQNYCPNGTEDFEIFGAAEKITGVHVNIRSLSTSASAEQFPVMIASGDYPDMVGWGLSYTSTLLMMYPAIIFFTSMSLPSNISDHSMMRR